jgi:hypothetical protein
MDAHNCEGAPLSRSARCAGQCLAMIPATISNEAQQIESRKVAGAESAERSPAIVDALAEDRAEQSPHGGGN